MPSAMMMAMMPNRNGLDQSQNDRNQSGGEGSDVPLTMSTTTGIVKYSTVAVASTAATRARRSMSPKVKKISPSAIGPKDGSVSVQRMIRLELRVECGYPAVSEGMFVAENGVVVKSLLDADAVRECRDDIWLVLEKTNEEYFPALSSREPGRIDQPPLLRKSLWPQPVDYFEEILKEHVVLAYIDDKVVGMMTYVPRFNSSTLAAWSPCTYIDTVGVIPGWRRRGVARAMYQALFEVESVKALPHVALRTWSTNLSHMSLLDKLGFEEVDRHLDERAPGVDTVYYARASTPSPFDDTAG
jgi:ribosomal protein S18 acetylase RimI-like enzyme